jgi:hypothetical protein
MKAIYIELPEKTYIELKKKCIDEQKTLKEKVNELIFKELNKKGV